MNPVTVRALTVDVESDWGGRSRSMRAIHDMIPVVLDILAREEGKATFFVSTETLPAAAPAIRAVADAGHEVASHGHDHALRYDLLAREALREQLQRSKALLEDATGRAVVGFRTPQFRKNQHTDDLLLELGYRYDSSAVRTALAGRYRADQHASGRVPEWTVSALHGRFPAGVKWINLLGAGFDGREPVVVYSHLFDLFSLRQTVAAWEPGIPWGARGFYLARLGGVLKTFAGLAGGSRTLASLLPEAG